MQDLQYSWNSNLQTPEARQIGLFLHLSQLFGLLIPFAGIVVPVIIWQVKKNEVPGLDAHGKMIVNWIISAVIYGLISFVLSFVLIGILGFLALAVMSIVFPIIGGIKANQGELWNYPLTIKFLK
jgi:uncharacterized Tic20 family protein